MRTFSDPKPKFIYCTCKQCVRSMTFEWRRYNR